MNDRAFLFWLVERLVHVYKESPDTDFVRKLKAIAENTNYGKDTGWS